MFRVLIITLVITPLLSACGFEPLYATNTTGGAPGLRDVYLETLTASESVDPIFQESFYRRVANSASARYDLIVEAEERADQLAVQIDASVTRYNYRINAAYTLTDRTSGEKVTGRVESIASFNVVASQYSTLFAERTAREKAAEQLVHLIERDIMLKLNDKS